MEHGEGAHVTQHSLAAMYDSVCRNDNQLLLPPDGQGLQDSSAQSWLWSVLLT